MTRMIQLGIEEDTAPPQRDADLQQRSEFLRCLFEQTHGSDAVPVYVENIVDELHLGEKEAETILQSLLDKDLIKLRLQCIVSITQAGIDQVKAAVDQPDQPSPPVAAVQAAVQIDEQIDDTQAGFDELKAAVNQKDPQAQPTALVPAPETTAQAEDQTAAIEALGAELVGILHARPDTLWGDRQPLPARFVDLNKESDELVALELKNICESIGLDPEEFQKEVAAWEHARAEMSSLQANDLPDILASLKLRLLKVRLPPDDLAEAEAEIATAIAQLLSPRPKLPIIAASLNTLLLDVEKAGAANLTSDIELSLSRIRYFLTQLPV